MCIQWLLDVISEVTNALCCRLVAKKCKGNRAGGQGFRLTWRKDVRYQSASGSCWDVSEGGQRAKVTRFACHGAGGNQYWKYDLVRASYGNTCTLLLLFIANLNLPNIVASYEGARI